MIIGSMTRIQGTRYTRYEVYEVYESSADAAWKAATLCLGTVPVVGYTYASDLRPSRLQND